MNVVSMMLEAGLTLASDGDRLLVTPRTGITTELRAVITENKPVLLAYARQVEVTAADLIQAINRCCDQRGDDESNRAGLIRECLELPSAAQADMTEHFAAQAALWARVTGSSDAQEGPTGA